MGVYIDKLYLHRFSAFIIVWR